MLEIPEAYVIARQVNETLMGKVIKNVTAAQTPHAYAWYFGDPAGYPAQLNGKTLGAAGNFGGMVEIQVEDVALLFGDGANLRFYQKHDDLPKKHQLLIEFSDSTCLCATIAMYGGMWCFAPGAFENPYYQAAKEKPSPLTDAFDYRYFSNLFTPETVKLSMKAFLATQQRIPGLGNGVLQDILFAARIHPKRKTVALSAPEKDSLFEAIITTSRDMSQSGGRDTERDLYGNPGGYITRMSKNNAGKPCQVCGSTVQKQAYMGGSIYFCPGCQPENR